VKSKRKKILLEGKNDFIKINFSISLPHIHFMIFISTFVQNTVSFH
jgi:hypothetical protein